jgi:hypothetical protein
MANETNAATVSKGSAFPIPGALSRRTVMNMLVTTAIFANATPALSQDDPIFAALDAHKQINAQLQAAFDVRNALEDSLPPSLRRSEQTPDGFKRFQDDDPRWIEVETLVNKLLDEETAHSIELLNTQPTTLSGVKALLEHVSAYEAEGNEWPTDLIDDGEEKRRWGRSWSYFFHRNLTEAMQAIA